MEKTKEPIPESSNEKGFSGDIPIVHNNNSQKLEQLFDGNQPEKAPEPQGSQHVSTESTEKLNKQLEVISDDLKNCQEHLCRLARETEELKAAEQIITNLSNRCKELSEQFHEREIILPVIRCLIRLVDSCHQQIDKFQEICAKHAESKNESAINAATFLIDTRKADLIEFENVLANLGVDSYQHHEDVFEPSLQKCINRIECEEQAIDHRIACRLLPGYRRYDKTIRKEYVNVYVLKNKTDNTNNGGN